MRLAVVARSPHQVACGEAVRAGWAREIGLVDIKGQPGDGKFVCCWGWRAGAAYRSQGKSVLVMERGYLGDRFYWYSLGWNGLNGRAWFPFFEDDGSRFRRHFSLMPWHDGAYVLVAGQVPGDASLQGKNLSSWYREACNQARVYGLSVKFRPHPQAVKRGYTQAPDGIEVDTAPLAESLAGAAVLLTWNSNAAVDAQIAGVPTVVLDCGSMAYEVSGHEIGDLVRLDRDPWAHRLAWKQWSLDEIASGLPFRGLSEDVLRS